MAEQSIAEKLRQELANEAADYDDAVADAAVDGSRPDLWDRAVELPIEVVSKIADELARLTKERDEAKDLIEKLASDPVAVHVNLLRGSIAKPSLRSMLHAYGLLDVFQQVLDIAARNEAHAAISKLQAALQHSNASNDSCVMCGTTREMTSYGDGRPVCWTCLSYGE